jgi:hypothetical protein
MPLLVVLVVAACGGVSSPSGSGNGEASKSAQQVLTDAVHAADGASSQHISGQLTSHGKQIGVDLTVVKGKGATGSFTYKGQKVDLLIIGTDAYMKAGAAFYAQFGGASGSAIGQMLQGKWLKFSTKDPQFGPITGIADSKTIFDELTSTHRTLTNKGATTYKGQSVVAIFDRTKSGTLYVAATGTHYPVAIVKTGAATGTITFDDWNKPVPLTAPSGAIDLSTLGG